jgi:hypothetical protein
MPQKSNKSIIVLLVVVLAVIAYLAYVNIKKTPSVNTPTQSQVLGNKDDLVAFSIAPGAEVSGQMHVTGSVKGGYFFENNIVITILDGNKQKTNYGPGHANGTSDWMTSGPVSFAIDFDFSNIPNGSYYIKITQDDPSGGESGRPVRFVLIPIVVNNSPAPIVSNSNITVYHNHGFTMELPVGYTPNEMESEGGPAISITLPNTSHLSYVTDAAWWEQYNLPSYQYVKNEKIGVTTFKVYTYSGKTYYWFRQGNVGYEFFGDKNLLKTFTFVGWN